MLKSVVDTTEFERNIKAIKDGVGGKRLADAVMAGGLVIEGGAKILCPVDTGTMRSSIKTVLVVSEAQRAEVDIGPSVHYAPYVELGTRYWPSGHPFLRPAADEYGGRAGVAVIGELGRAIAMVTGP